jgi:hypothetical protein
MPLGIPPPGATAGGGLPDNTAAPGTGIAVPTGVESIIEYNGLLMNDTTTTDKIRITEIDGLADADIRDARDQNPGFHGETAFDAFYGGRTITLTGRIEAYTLEKLRDMQAALHLAFAELSEKPLIFRTGNWRRDHMIYCRKINPISMRESQGNWNFYRDFVVTLRASNPRILSYQENVADSFYGFFDPFDSDTLTNYSVG